MITREDVIASSGGKCDEYENDCPTCFVNQLLDERDAYREVANKYRALWVSEGRYSDNSVASQVVDSEAAQIMKEADKKK